MKSMQKTILDAIEKRVKTVSENLDINTTYSYSNCGKAYIMDDFKNLLSFTFNFQDNYCSILFFKPNYEPIGGMIREGEYGCIKNYGYLQYHKTDQIKDLLNFVSFTLEDALGLTE
jgi:hypothetical protein